MSLFQSANNNNNFDNNSQININENTQDASDIDESQDIKHLVISLIKVYLF